MSSKFQSTMHWNQLPARFLLNAFRNPKASKQTKQTPRPKLFQSQHASQILNLNALKTDRNGVYWSRILLSKLIINPMCYIRTKDYGNPRQNSESTWRNNTQWPGLSASKQASGSQTWFLHSKRIFLGAPGCGAMMVYIKDTALIFKRIR